MNGTEPAWCEEFLRQLRETARDGRPDQKLSAELAGVTERRVYYYRQQRSGAEFRQEWERTLEEIRQLWESRHRAIQSGRR